MGIREHRTHQAQLVHRVPHRDPLGRWELLPDFGQGFSDHVDTPFRHDINDAISRPLGPGEKVVVGPRKGVGLRE